MPKDYWIVNTHLKKMKLCKHKRGENNKYIGIYLHILANLAWEITALSPLKVHGRLLS